jgi:hypothetical protein
MALGGIFEVWVGTARSLRGWDDPSQPVVGTTCPYIQHCGVSPHDIRFKITHRSPLTIHRTTLNHDLTCLVRDQKSVVIRCFGVMTIESHFF